MTEEKKRGRISPRFNLARLKAKLARQKPEKEKEEPKETDIPVPKEWESKE